MTTHGQSGNFGLIKVDEQPEPTMSSREISELTSKQHQHVKRDIERMLVELDLDVSTFGRIYLDTLNRQQNEYILSKKLVECLLLGYSAKARYKVLERLEELENEAKASTSPSELSRMEILQIAMDSERGRIEEQKLRVEAEKSEKKAIRQKGQISRSREAKAMSTAGKLAKANRELKAEITHLKAKGGHSERDSLDIPVVGQFDKQDHHVSRKTMRKLMWDWFGLPKNVINHIVDNQLIPVAKILPPIDHEHAYYLVYDIDEAKSVVIGFIKQCKKTSKCRAIHPDFDKEFSLLVDPKDYE